MSYSLYFVIRQILMGLLSFLGLHMIFDKLPKALQHSFYQQSLKTMGIAFLIVPLSCLAYSKDNQLDLEPYIATAINLGAYFATFTLMAIAFLTLLGRKYSKPIYWLTLAAIILYGIPLSTGILSEDIELLSTIITASYSYLIAMVVILVVLILRNYNKVSRNLENYYSQEIIICVRWITKSIKLLIGLAVTCTLAPIFFVYPLWLRLIFMLYGVFCYLHIYNGYKKMQNNITEYLIEQNQSLEKFTIIEQINNKTTTLSPEVEQNIQNQLKIWLSKKQYLEKNTTIDDLAKQIKTNRTYLSRYINTKYKCTFKRWITLLRIEEAKKLLVNNKEKSINNIAITIGFSSIESFTHIFTRIEGKAPSKWREEQTKKTK